VVRVAGVVVGGGGWWWVVAGVAGINHCSLHCHLAEFRGLMRRAKYGAVIGHTVAHTVVSEMLAPNGQSQRRILHFSSNHGVSPNDSVSYSG
jgi:hypothetical protein